MFVLVPDARRVAHSCGTDEEEEEEEEGGGKRRRKMRRERRREKEESRRKHQRFRPSAPEVNQVMI